MDAKIRGIHYRLHIAINATDAKVLTSSKFYDGDEINFLAAATKGTSDCHFIDVGANTGYYSLNLSRLGYSKIVAIEPNPTTFAILTRNIEINDLQDRVHACQLCIGEGGEAPFFMSGDLGTASIFAEDHAGSHIMVKSAPLNNILEENKVAKIGGMKVDIEGYEDRALISYFESAAHEKWPARMIIEHCNQDKWASDLEKFLQQIGYRVSKKSRANLFMELKS